MTEGKDEVGSLKGEIEGITIYDETNNYKGLRPGSKLAKAREIILTANLNGTYPLHLDEIFSEFEIPPDPRFDYEILRCSEKNSLIGMLNTYCRKQKVFIKKGRNMFGLIEIEEANNER